MFRAACCLSIGLWLMLGAAGAADAPARSPAEIMDILMWNREPVGGPFELTDHTGRIRTDRDFRGQLMLVYFGFSWCPDICPADLQAIGLALDKLGSDAARVQPLFVTVDPERDTPAVMKDYLSSFDPRIIGLSGDRDAIDKVEKAYRVYARKGPPENGGYGMDHSSIVYLMDAQGKFVEAFNLERKPEESAKELERYL
jgi:cytochrome oxidase Cu insertion factor (SCO1/SenC/PrrC family)